MCLKAIDSILYLVENIMWYGCHLPFQNLWPFQNGHGHFETATAVLIPFQGLEMAWPC